MPNPKKRMSHQKRNSRRAHDALVAPQLSLCSNCKEKRLNHRVCPHCGFYDGRQVLSLKKD